MNQSLSQMEDYKDLFSLSSNGIFKILSFDKPYQEKLLIYIKGSNGYISGGDSQ